METLIRSGHPATGSPPPPPRPPRGAPHAHPPVSLGLLILSLLLGSAGCTSPLRPEAEGGPTLSAGEFTFDSGGSALYYEFPLSPALSTPAGADTLIFFVSGSGCRSVRDRFPHYLAPLYGARGWVFILQKRGIRDGSRGLWCSRSFIRADYFESILSDQLEFIRHTLDTLPRRCRNVVLIGASEGSLVAAELARREPRITLLGLIGSGGTRLRDYLLRLEGLGRPLGGVEQMLNDIAADPDDLDRRALGHSYRYWSSFLDIDLRQILPQLSIPVIVAMGEEDSAVPAETLDLLIEAHEGARNGRLTTLVYLDADHRLVDRDRSIPYSGHFLQTLASQMEACEAPAGPLAEVPPWRSSPLEPDDPSSPLARLPGIDGERR